MDKSIAHLVKEKAMREKGKKPEVLSRYWQVYITNENADFTRRNMTLGVVAPDMDTAIKLARDAHPGAEIWTVQHRGEINLQVIDMKFGYGFHVEDKGGVRP